jgi:hypothetical protein
VVARADGREQVDDERKDVEGEDQGNDCFHVSASIANWSKCTHPTQAQPLRSCDEGDAIRRHQRQLPEQSQPR